MQIKDAPHTENVRSFRYVKNSWLVCIFAGMVLNDNQTYFSPAPTHPRKAFSLPSIQEHPTICCAHCSASKELSSQHCSVWLLLESRDLLHFRILPQPKTFSTWSPTSAGSDVRRQINICQTVANWGKYAFGGEKVQSWCLYIHRSQIVFVANWGKFAFGRENTWKPNSICGGDTTRLCHCIVIVCTTA